MLPWAIDWPAEMVVESIGDCLTNPSLVREVGHGTFDAW